MINTYEKSTDNYVMRNRAELDRLAPDYAVWDRDCWESDKPCWGIWGIPETDVQLLPDVNGLDVIELGCGTAYVSYWLMKRGARVTGIDNSPAQLATAKAFQAEFRHFTVNTSRRK